MAESPSYGWFISRKIPSFEMDENWGYPHDYMEPPISNDIGMIAMECYGSICLMIMMMTMMMKYL